MTSLPKAYELEIAALQRDLMQCRAERAAEEARWKARAVRLGLTGATLIFMSLLSALPPLRSSIWDIVLPIFLLTVGCYLALGWWLRA
jgi:hypothetical protein